MAGRAFALLFAKSIKSGKQRKNFFFFQKLANVISQNEFDCVSQKNMSAIIQKRKEKEKIQNVCNPP
jgi:hypothetical protein